MKDKKNIEDLFEMDEEEFKELIKESKVIKKESLFIFLLLTFLFLFGPTIFVTWIIWGFWGFNIFYTFISSYIIINVSIYLTLRGW